MLSIDDVRTLQGELEANSFDSPLSATILDPVCAFRHDVPTEPRCESAVPRPKSFHERRYAGEMHVIREVLPGIHCHGADVDGKVARQAQELRRNVDPWYNDSVPFVTRRNSDRTAFRTETVCAGSQAGRTVDAQYSAFSHECSWGTVAVPLQTDECVDELHPVDELPSDVSVRIASVSAMNAPTPRPATLEEKPEMSDPLTRPSKSKYLEEERRGRPDFGQ